MTHRPTNPEPLPPSLYLLAATLSILGWFLA